MGVHLLRHGCNTRGSIARQKTGGVRRLYHLWPVHTLLRSRLKRFNSASERPPLPKQLRRQCSTTAVMRGPRANRALDLLPHQRPQTSKDGHTNTHTRAHTHTWHTEKQANCYHQCSLAICNESVILSNLVFPCISCMKLLVISLPNSMSPHSFHRYVHPYEVIIS